MFNNSTRVSARINKLNNDIEVEEEDSLLSGEDIFMKKVDSDIIKVEDVD